MSALIGCAHANRPTMCGHIFSITEDKVANKAVHLHGLIDQSPMNVHHVVISTCSRFPGSCEIVTCDSLEAFGIGQSVSLDHKLS